MEGMKIESIEIGLIKPYKQNAKTHGEKQIEKVANSIQRFGWVQPLVVDQDYNLVIGHCRLLAAFKLNLTVVPALRVENLSNDEIKALRLADNKLNESEWDMDLVKTELCDLGPEFLDLTGFTSEVLLGPEEKDESIPPTPTEPKTKLGDFYILGGRHRLLCGDCLSLDQVDRLLDGKTANVLITDPPYGV